MPTNDFELTVPDLYKVRGANERAGSFYMIHRTRITEHRMSDGCAIIHCQIHTIPLTEMDGQRNRRRHEEGNIETARGGTKLSNSCIHRFMGKESVYDTDRDTLGHEVESTSEYVADYACLFYKPVRNRVFLCKSHRCYDQLELLYGPPLLLLVEL